MEFIERKKKERGGRKVEEGRKGGEEEKKRKEKKRREWEMREILKVSHLTCNAGPKESKILQFALGGDKDDRGRAGSASLLIKMAYLDKEKKLLIVLENPVDAISTFCRMTSGFSLES